VSVLNAGILAAGLAALALPILIHLLMRRRRKPVQWGAMRFLEEAIRRTRRRLLVERWLLLAVRCLLVAAIAVALGRPLLDQLALTGRAGGGGATVLILIDNGLASQATDPATGTTALQRHLAAARAALGELVEGDRVGLIALAHPAGDSASATGAADGVGGGGGGGGGGGVGGGTLLPPTANLAAALAGLDAIRPSDARTDLAGGLALAAAAFTQADPTARIDPRRSAVLVLSDFAAGSADLDAVLPRLPAGVPLLASAPPASGEAGAAVNVAIRAVRAARSVLLTGASGDAARSAADSGSAQAVTVALSRSGPGQGQPGTSSVTVRLEASAVSPGDPPTTLGSGTATVRWAPGQREASATVVLDAAPLPGASPAASSAAPAGAVLAATIGPDANSADNRFRLPVEVREVLRVGVIAGPRPSGTGPESLTTAQWLRLALRPREDSVIEVIELDSTAIDPAALLGLDAVVVADPQRLTEADWPRLRQFARGGGGSGGAGGVGGASSVGGVVIIFPPADRTVHVWSDPMVRGLGLPLELARESKDLAEPAAEGEAGALPGRGGVRIAPEAPTTLAASTGLASTGPASAASSAATLAGTGDLLAPIRGELPDLAPVVSVRRVLPVVAAREGASAVLTLTDGTGLIWTASAEGEAGGASGGGGGGGRGAIIYVATALDLAWTDLPVKPLMVPLMQELIRQGVGRARPGTWAAAGARLEAGGQAVRLAPWADVTSTNRAAGERAEPITLTESGQTEGPIRHAGVWDALDARGARRGVLAVNPDTAGSPIDRLDPMLVQAWLAGASADGSVGWTGGGGALPPEARRVESVSAALTSSPAARASGPEWLWAAVLLALIEVVLARRASHAGVVFLPKGAPA
jgi:hypothetical protein